MREAWKRETYVRSQSFSSESAVKYLHVGRRKIQISPPPGEQDQSNALPLGQQRQSNASELSQAVNRLILRLKFIVTVELLYDQAESDFVHCQTKMRAFAHRMCSEFKQIELN